MPTWVPWEVVRHDGTWDKLNRITILMGDKLFSIIIEMMMHPPIGGKAMRMCEVPLMVSIRHLITFIRMHVSAEMRLGTE